MVSSRAWPSSPVADAELELELVDAELVSSAGTVASVGAVSPLPPPRRPSRPSASVRVTRGKVASTNRH
jgi:hypothetical protein